MSDSHILLIEADPAMLHILEATLHFGGYLTASAPSAAEAFERLFELGRYDAIVIDFRLPGGAGYELLAAIRTHSQIVPVVVLSGASSPEERIRVLDAGADDFIETPFMPGELLARVRAALRKTAAVKRVSGARGAAA